MVDINSEHYRVARDYMIRLQPSDLTDAPTLQRLADVAKMTPDQLRELYEGVP
jgi:6-phosphofructokinase 1